MEHPQPGRYRPRPTWHRSNLRQFLAAQAEHIVAVDFLHVDTINLKRIYALVMLEHGSRRAHLLGVTANPTGPWTTQAARNFLMVTGMNIAGIEFLIRDHGGQFTDAFDAACVDVGLRVLKSPPRPRRRTRTAKGSSAPCAASPRPGTHPRRTAPAPNPHQVPGALQRAPASPRTEPALCPSQAEAGPPRPIDLAEHRVHRTAILGGLINEYQIAS
ncbi:hypothetical protein [Streptomyces sp. NPDC056690]|uniref:hypothetical protein n=1 Tax=unclassified Streptomyces TaxID=2593676 RepID=UPI00363C2E51